MALVGNLISCLRVKSETKSVTPDTAFRFNSKDDGYAVTVPETTPSVVKSDEPRYV
jgi:hypothetical protein